MMDELIAALKIQMNLHKVIMEFLAYGHETMEAAEAITSAQRSLENNERVIEHLIRESCGTLQ